MSLLWFSKSSETEAALALIRELADDPSLRLRGACMLRWPAVRHGPEVRQVLPAGAGRALGGAFWDMLVIIAYLLPAAGAAAGASPSACRCSLAGLGISDDFLRHARRHAGSGREMLILMTGHTNVDPILSMLGHVGFSVTSTNLTSRQLCALEAFFGPASGPGRDESAPAGGDLESELAR